MIRISQCKLPIDHTKEDLEQKISKTLRLGTVVFTETVTDVPSEDYTYEILRQSLDARKKEEKHFSYTIDVRVPQEANLLKKLHDKNLSVVHPSPYRFPAPGDTPLKERPVIIGFGPAGIFCAWYLARAGYRPIVLERGEDADTRRARVTGFWEKGLLDPNSNVQFGEGGAGTFSDGKLNTLVKDPYGRNREVLKRFVEAGAPREILYQQKPHLGTDVLVGLVKRLRQQIGEMGGTIRFGSQVTDFRFSQERLEAVEINHTEWLPARVCVLAVGHSARDTFAVLDAHHVRMQPKAFAVGVRIEHPQAMINQAMYGEEKNPYLGAAAYKLTHTCKNGRGVYTFCMCPGGYVVNASTEDGRLAVNGMSYQARDGENANSALIVTVTPADFGEEGPLAGVAFQRRLEHAAWQAGEGSIPLQLFGDFQKGQKSVCLGSIRPNMKGSWQLANVREILPAELAASLEEGILAMGKKIPGFDRPDALLSGIESRTSSPVRITRDEYLESNYQGLYPCGEGAGYAGGITSAAMDGIKVAETIARRFTLC